MDQIKIGLIFRESTSPWISCQSINRNLIEAYSESGSVQVFKLYSEESVYSVVERIINSKIKVLVIADHQVRLLEIFRIPELIKYIVDKKIKILIHVFGCYVDRLVEYVSATKELINQDFLIIASSLNHQRLVQKTIKNVNSAEYVPFPVDTKTFVFNDEARKKTREKLLIDDETPLFVYTGRISAQKNVELCMQFLSEIKQKKKVRFIYCGFFDNFEPIEGRLYKGEMAQFNARHLAKVNLEDHWCKYQSFLERDELINLLSGADAFISLSTSRGEDFGMAIAEARSMGLPSFLTQWGGYASFKNIKHSFFAPVKILEDDLEINLAPLVEPLLHFKIPKAEQRKKIHEDTHKEFGIQNVSLKLKQIVLAAPIPFIGFNSSFAVRRELAGAGNLNVMIDLKDLYEEYCR